MAKAKSYKKSQSKFNELVSDIRENVSEGAKALGKMSSEFLEETKEKAEELYEAGYEKFEQASGVIQDYVDRYNGNREIQRLTEQKKILITRFGDSVFHEFKKNGTVSKRFLTTKKMSALKHEIEQIDRSILKIGRELDKKMK